MTDNHYSRADGHYYPPFEETLEPGDTDQFGNTYVWMPSSKNTAESDDYSG